MYKYFFGKKSNLKTKKSTDPLVIKASSQVINEIDKWLLHYSIDSDLFFDFICTVCNSTITKITIDDTQIFKFYFEDGFTPRIELKFLDIPTIKLSFDGNEYNYVINDNRFYLENCTEISNGIMFGLDVVYKTINMGNRKVFISIGLDKFIPDLYNCVKKHAKLLYVWDDLMQLLEWIKSLPIKIDTYDLSVVALEKEYIGMNKLCIIQNKIFRYIHVNPTGQFWVDYDGSWEAEYNGYRYKFDVFEKKCNIYFPRKKKVNKREFQTCYNLSINLINVMMGTLILFNNTMEHWKNDDNCD